MEQPSEHDRKALQSLIAKLKRIKSPTTDTVRTLERLQLKYNQLYCKSPMLKLLSVRKAKKKK